VYIRTNERRRKVECNEHEKVEENEKKENKEDKND
jgi:hypothetical protein